MLNNEIYDNDYEKLGFLRVWKFIVENSLDIDQGMFGQVLCWIMIIRHTRSFSLFSL